MVVFLWYNRSMRKGIATPRGALNRRNVARIPDPSTERQHRKGWKPKVGGFLFAKRAIIKP